MEKVFIFFLFIFLSFFAVAQDEDYVISKPAEPEKEIFNTIPNPDYTNYLLNSSAYTLKKRDIRISGTDIIYAKGSYGLTDNTMVSVSISLIGTLIGSIKQQININEDVKMGASISVGQLLSVPEDSMIFFAGGQAMFTLGNIQNNITVGTGIYYAKGTFDLINEEREFFLNNVYVATQKQISRRVYLMAEGIYFWNYNVFSGAAGFKVTIKKRMSLSFGVMPIVWKNPTINNSYVEGNLMPILSFRILLDRH